MPETTETTDPNGTVDTVDTGATARNSGTLRAVVLTVVIMLLVIGVGVAGFLAMKYRGEAQRAQQVAADRARAEDIAGKFAVGASNLDFNDLAPWLKATKTGVTEDVAKRFDAAAELMRQVAVTVRLQTKGTLVAAKTTSEVNGVYKVAAFVDIETVSLQAPQGTIATSGYTITVDRNQNWLITQSGDPASMTQLPIDGAASATAPAPPSPAPSSPAPVGGN